MSIVRKLKSLLGLGDGGSEPERDVTVTVEHDPENEAAVKGADVESSTSSGGSHAVAVSGDEEEPATDKDDAAATADEAEAADADEAPESAEEETPEEVEIPDAEEPEASEEAAEAETDEEGDEEAAGEEAAAAEEEEDGGSEEEDGGSEEEDGSTEEDAGSDEPVDVLNGIGPAYADRLADAGVETVGDLASADPAELAEAADIAEGRIQGWIDQAAEY